MTPKERVLEKLKRREALTAEIVADLDEEIDELLAWAPDSLTPEDRKGIQDEVTAQTRLVTNALSTEELESEGARRSFMNGTLAEVQRLIYVRTEQRKNK